MPGYGYSFSGIKTSVLYFLRDKTKEEADFVQQNLADICASVQNTLIKTLLKKLVQASKDLGINEIAIAGGVSANSGLRRTLQEYAKEHSWNVYIPAFQYCTDNAGMIAMAAHFKFIQGDFASQYISPEPRLKIG